MASSTPKTMSSRLMTMKFMQRSVTKSSPSASSPSSPSGPSPAKKARLSYGASVPGTPGTPSDFEMMQSAIAAEEKKREEALVKQAEKSGETKWELSFQQPVKKQTRAVMRVRTAGFAVIDAEVSDDDDIEEGEDDIERGNVGIGRMTFGGGVVRKEPTKRVEDQGSSSEEDSNSELDSDDPTAQLIRETRREAHRTYGQGQRENEKPKPGKTSLDEDTLPGGLRTLSGGGRLGAGGGLANMTCHGCGHKGHLIRDCPKKPGSTPRRCGRGRSRMGGRAGGAGRR